MGLTEFLFEFKYVLLFYVVIILIVYLNRKKFEIQAKIIAIYRTQFGVKLINKVGKSYEKIIKVLGYIGIPVGYLGMGFIIFVIGDGILKVFLKPDAPPVVSPVLPGLPVPGLGIVVPFFQGIIALFIVIVIHEFAHGIVARAHNIPIKGTGFVLFGPIPGAFVDPNEKNIEKSKKKIQLSIFAAGPFSNVLTALLLVLIMGFLIAPALANVLVPEGFYFPDLREGGPADLSGVPIDVVFDRVDGTRINSTYYFIEYMKDVEPGSEVLVANEKSEYLIRTGEHPENKSKSYLGVGLMTKYKGDEGGGFKTVIWFYGLLNWLFIFSLGLGLANLLPLGPVDGGRMFQVAMQRYFGKEKGHRIWVQISIIVLFILVMLLIQPFFRMLFP